MCFCLISLRNWFLFYCDSYIFMLINYKVGAYGKIHELKIPLNYGFCS